MLKMDLRRIRKQRKTSVRERFALFTLEFTEFVKGFVEAGRKKNLLVEDRKRRRIC